MSKSFVRTIKNVANGYTSAQVMVRNATSNEPHGPTIAQMADVANHTYESAEFLPIMDIIDKRMNDKGKNWRHVAKSLTLLDYLVRYGSNNVVIWSKDNLYVIKTLREFQHVDDSGTDQGVLIRVKAKELTALLQDEERLRQEREIAREKRGRRSGRRRGDDDDFDQSSRAESRNPDSPYDEELQRALDASKETAEEEERRRRLQSNSDESLQKALQLSKEEEEMRQKNNNLIDLGQPAPVSGPVIIGYDVFGNPIYQSQTMATGVDVLQQQQQQQQQLAYQQALLEQQQQAAQQQAYLEQQAYQQALAEQQAAQQAYLFQQQQQQLQQQQQQQQQLPLQTGSNNPFSFGGPSQEDYSNNVAAQQTFQPQQQQFEQQPQQPQQPQRVQTQRTGSQAHNDKYSELNNLLAQGTGIDTFGNTGDTRVPAQHTKTGTFINSQGTGYKQENFSSANPFVGTQYTGISSTNIIPAYTGYGFGNQNQSQSQSQSQSGSRNSRANSTSLIDI
ncbi:Clathrin recruitment epsin-like protein [Komagataella phaffii CBS 7435]|uniref:Epsin-like protein involved in endocytosis and actin patch assembly n=2 Tax=Komagataella phaffii TaxID=460519 RepID=C4QXV6_KOMPG|nr:Epsin-like protein involved in endocytosis and actin patch assembly [Komagataella phaffii GS115]AOA60757.1 GQ67_01934T0 [Komagataella phaffii]CAH2446896.1 Clathrin recruitment epsin-like protein [Komagataella phaffii CBS 7435]AOA66857.1 GQ68_01949T0 [Komagataella phaffii GS115]CAY68079.1 Epsin-like protein involved in endocytosis and actin patch assembly [Komagataella phaffii GS115]CCA37154.1 Clathrin recruitment epsin-like protein [Komagataella phaffii CBS 7435]